MSNGQDSSKPNTKWTSEIIHQGIERFIKTTGRIPTARDFDENEYLPSARQIQRAYGGLVELRKSLGYEDTDFTKGELRKLIASKAGQRGVSAEDFLEPILIAKFGEPYVHVQKRYYKGSRSRYDFFVYYSGGMFGVDTFTTDRANYIEKNIRHKVTRYKDAPSELPIYFVLMGGDFTPQDVSKAVQSVSDLKNHNNMTAIYESDFLKLIDGYTPLAIPSDFMSMSKL
ncbi:MAG: hypothetical protein WAS36_00260 [Candidatus Saccharimonadales bacterium]